MSNDTFTAFRSKLAAIEADRIAAVTADRSERMADMSDGHMIPTVLFWDHYERITAARNSTRLRYLGEFIASNRGDESDVVSILRLAPELSWLIID